MVSRQQWQAHTHLSNDAATWQHEGHSWVTTWGRRAMAEVSCSACSCRKSVLAFSAKPITVAKLVTPSCTIQNHEAVSGSYINFGASKFAHKAQL